MFKNFAKSLILTSVILSAFSLLFSCSVGLGESVDTEVPKVEITYPPASSAVRDWFYLAGNCSDDKGVDSIVVSAKNISTNENFTLGTAIPAKDGTWQIKINEKDSGGNYKLKDGTYTFSVIATDSSKQQSAPNIRTLEIDNTAPVFVIKNPGTTKSDSPAPFGSILKIVGAAADEHEIYELELKVYSSADMSGEPKATLIEKNVDKTDGINVTLARYNPDVALGAAAADELHNNYLSIYNAEGGGDQQLFASVTLRDSAGVWQNPLHTAAESIGNSTSGGLYLNDDIYDELMGKKSKYGLTAADFMKIINGTYKNVTAETSENENSENNRAVETDSSKITEENIQEVLEILNKAKTDTSSTPLSFKLNKDANPTYEVMGFAFKDSEISSFGSHKAAKQSSLTFKAQAGLDGTYLRVNTLKIYMFGPYDDGTYTKDLLEKIRTEPEEFYNDAVANAKATLTLKEENPSEELITATAKARILLENQEGNSTETFTKSFELPSIITKGKHYVIAASGEDLDGLSLVSSNYYGFVGESAGTPPTIVIDGFKDGDMKNDLGSVKISGTLASEEVELAGVTYSVVVFDEINSKSVGTITGAGKLDFGSDNKKLSGNWNFALGEGIFKKDNGYSSYIPEDGKRFKYTVTVSGKDTTGLESKDTKSFTIDMQKPEIKINDVTPIAKKETEESGTTKYTVNGTVKFSAVVTDTNLQNVVATVSDGKGTEISFGGNSSVVEKEGGIDTTQFDDNTYLTFKVVATDTAGNKSEKSISNVFVSQQTDKPVISFTNGKTSAELGDGWTNVTNGQNVFGIENNNSANFTITDDDGIASVKLTVFDESGNEINCSENNNYQLQPQSDMDGAEPVNPVEYEVGGATTYAVSYKLPKKAGKYKIQLDVLDIGYATASETNKKWHTTTTESYVLVSEGNISISFVDILNNTCKVNANNDAAINGTVNVSSLEKLASIERFESTKETSKDSDGKDVETWKKATSASAKYPYAADEQDVTKKIEAKEDNGKISWTDTIPSAKIEDGVQHFFYQATDIAGNSAEIELICNGDGNAPEIKIDSEVYKKYENWVNSSSVKLSVIAADVNGYEPSGIKKVSYSYGDNSTGELSRGEKCNADGTSNTEGIYYKYSTTIDLAETPVSGTMITFTAEDNVGNKMPLAPLAYKVDTTAPKVEYISVDASQVLNNSGSIKVSYSVSDELSGVKSVEFSTNSNMAGAKSVEFSTNSNTEPVKEAKGSYNYSLAELADGEYNIYVRVTDNAGNKLENINAGSFIVDSTAPKVTITSPVSGSNVNKTISLSGTVVDNNLSSEQPTLKYKKVGEETWNTYNISDSQFNRSSDQSWTISNIDTTKLNSSEQATEFEFLVVFKDLAENENVSLVKGSDPYTYKLTVDQNSDRPEVKLTNILISGSKINSKEIVGVITDDDGDYSNLKLYRIEKNKYDSDSTTNATPSTAGNSWTQIENVDEGTGIWRASLADDEKQGEKNWYFYVIDSKGGTFCSVANANSSLAKIYLSDSKTTKQDSVTGISFVYDSEAPKVEIKVTHDQTNWEDTNFVFGKEQAVYVKAVVTEEVGMDSVTLTVNGITQTIQSTDANKVVGKESEYEYKFAKIDLSSAEYENIPDGSISISVEAKDSSGQKNKDMKNITVDKTAPTVKIVSPTTAVSDAITGAVTIKGIALDNASSISRVQYLIPTVAQAKLEKTVENFKAANWKDIGNSGSWEIQFASGAAESPDSILYYVGAKENNANFYAVEQFGSDEENLWKVPVYFQVTDSCGNSAVRTTYKDSNSNEEKPLFVIVDPDGGKPKAWINSPEEGSTTSGLVTIYGGASDDISVDRVQIQIDANGDGNFDSADYTLLNSASGSWAGTEAKQNLGGSASDWWISANGTNSWKRAIDTDKIANSSDGKKYLRFRVRAYDGDTQTRGWSKVVSVNIDSEVPVIKDLKVVQFGAGVTADSSTVSGLTPITEREYISGMYISNIMEKSNGTFYLVGTVTDNQQVKTITFEKQTTSSSVPNIDLGIQKEVSNSSDSYNLCVPLKTEQSGQIYYIIKAFDNNTGETTQSIVINIDSTKPGMFTTGGSESQNIGENLRLKSLGKNLGMESSSSTVVNSNSYFTFGDIVSESGSGLAYIVATFERNGSASGKRIYNPMQNNIKLSLASSESEATASGKPYICEEGFAIQTFDVTRDDEYSIKATAFTQSAISPFIQKGGLVRIAGTYCLITDFESSSGKITLSKSVSTNFTKAELIFGQVIDHQIVETPKTDGGVENDDGDGMVETITQIGSSYTWTASIDSTKIPDGPITIHVVAIDNAGNTNYGYIKTKVENNRPRIAKVMLATDLNGNGKFDYAASSAPITGLDGETVNNRTADGAEFGEFSFYSAMESKSTNLKSEVELKSGKFKVIGELAILPEFVGGNGDIYYVEKCSNSSESADYTQIATGVMNADLVKMASKSSLTGSMTKFANKDTNPSGVTYKDLISDKGGIVLTMVPQKYISYTFWDSTEETTPGTDSQWAHLMIPVTLLSSETEKPVPTIRPFYWESKSENSVEKDSAGNLLGHIELEGDLTNEIMSAYGDSSSLKKPKVSGKIKIEGTVTDNVRISSIDMGFDGLFSSATLANYKDGSWQNVSSLPTGVISFTVQDVSISQKGHEAKYTLVVDTEKLTDVAGKNKNITISAMDWKRNTSIAGTIQTTASAKTAMYTVDVVPYVTGIGTELSAFYRSASSVYARTSTGRYPLHENESITFYGFNLGTPSVALNETTLYSGGTEVSLSDIVGGANIATRTTGTTAKSGAFTVSVNSLQAINNMNDNTKEYNQQPNNVNNNILTDDLYADVWQFKNAAEPINGGAKYVTMKINPKTGVPGFSYANSILYFNMPGYNSNQSKDNWGAISGMGSTNYSQIPFGMNYGGFSHNTFTFDDNGYSYGAAMCTDTSTANESAFFQFFSREAPLPISDMNQNMNYANTWNASRLDSSSIPMNGDSSGWTTDIDRIQSVSMDTFIKDNLTYVFMAYYDRPVKQIRFRWGTVGNDSYNIDGKSSNKDDNSFSRVQNSYGLDDIVDSRYTGAAQAREYDTGCRPNNQKDSYVKYSYNNNSGIPIQIVAASGVSGARGAYSVSKNGGAGEYVSLAIVNKDSSNPIAVVSWYDSKNMQLCMAYNTNPTTSNNWVSKVVDSNGGINVKIAADSDGGIHFAYYDNKGGSDLKYAYMSSYAATPQIVSVDSFGSVGAKCTIDLAKNASGKWIPYIGYQMNAYLGTPLAAKIAYLPDGVSGTIPAGVDNKDCYTGDWEVSIVPTSNIPNDDLINVGVWRDSNGNAQAFTSNSNWSTGDVAPGQVVSNKTLNVGNATIVHGNNTSNPIIGYGIDTGSIEMAQKK